MIDDIVTTIDGIIPDAVGLMIKIIGAMIPVAGEPRVDMTIEKKETMAGIGGEELGGSHRRTNDCSNRG
jgi:hypothetical protein